MPTYLRLFYIRKLLDAKEQEKTEMDKMNSKASTSAPTLPSIPKR
jgi:hypothetical protein